MSDARSYRSVLHGIAGTVGLAMLAGILSTSALALTLPERAREPERKTTRADDTKPRATDGAAGSEAEGSPRAQPAEPTEPIDLETVVITNDVLDRLYRKGDDAGGGLFVVRPVGAAPVSAEEAAAFEEAAWRRLRGEQARKADVERLRATLEAEIASLEARLESLERRKLAIVNPYLPRPQLTEAEREEWSGLSAKERVELTERQIRTVEDELATLRNRLDGLGAAR